MPTEAAALAQPRAPGIDLRRAWRVVSMALTLAVSLGWFFVLRPQSLAGPADYVLVSGRRMLPTLKNGDLVIVRRQGAYHVGDILACLAAGLAVAFLVPGAKSAVGEDEDEAETETVLEQLDEPLPPPAPAATAPVVVPPVASARPPQPRGARRPIAAGGLVAALLT